ncbi:hypothetical protein UP10_00315 [Bradyrhizobium sp. LTSPM299]|uniref:hypothetical protein n=1 Tax=Bradyrhizobium sp. LTSPM299 TaxID=1619233 RepID=UPI0005CA4E19|nr:hypothetical protein [Bradyrhizobium sp. LTSPM299]KJC62671.1 hypothetical protein UP10_00315 [Bradyrhizobium sp. LTSPM299]
MTIPVQAPIQPLAPQPPAPAGWPITIDVPAESKSTPLTPVQTGDVISFSATGRWKDWWISCGPDGYRNFFADIIRIRPRFADENWFCLCGEVEGTGERFAIGRGCTHTLATSGNLILFANDRDDLYGNNSGSVSVTADRGGIAPSQADADPDAFKGLTGRWRLIHRTFDMTRGVGTLAILVPGACLILALLPQGVDLVRSVGDDTLHDASTSQLFAFVLGLLFLGIQSWLWPRLLIDFNYGTDRSTWRPRRLLEWGPRVLGIAPFVLIFIALYRNPQFKPGLPIILVVVAAIFLILLIKREDWTKKMRVAGRISFARWWVIVCLALAAVLMAVVSLAPVAFGHALGAPAVVFVGLGLIIPPMIIAIQSGTGLRLPIVGSFLLAAALFSLWMDNHEVGGRAFERGPGPLAVAQRLNLADAYALWKSGQPVAKDGKRPMVLVASEGGASRAGDWTAEVLSALHAQSDGKFATHLFAISSVSGGSVGTVGYSAMLHVEPAVTSATLAKTLPTFTSQDALSPTLAGTLFPDLLQRFLPRAFLPDRAEALERAWEVGWNNSCPAKTANCKDLLQQPFLTLRPQADQPWRPILIVNGASQETGRRILTSTVDLEKAVDADDFHTIFGHDIEMSTAISNGARFPWISPAGTLPHAKSVPQEDLLQEHLLDGGYFDAAGVATLSELAQAIVALPDARDDKLHFIFVFIGYEEATADARPLAQQPVTGSVPAAGAPAKPAATSARTPEQPKQRSQGAPFLNEVIAPLEGLFASRTAHEAHIMEVFKKTPPLPADVPHEFIAVMLCNGKVDGKPFEPPMDWALSGMARQFIHDALSANSNIPCSEDNVAALQKINGLITR